MAVDAPEAITLFTAVSIPVPVPDAAQAIDMAGRRALTLAVIGTFTGHVNFECTLDRTTWYPLHLQQISDKAQLATYADAQSGWTLPQYMPMAGFRCSVDPLTAGAVTVQALTGS